MATFNFDAITIPLNYLSFGETTTYLSLIPVFLTALMGLALTRNPKKWSLTQLPLSLGLGVCGVHVGALATVGYILLHTFASLGMGGIGGIITSTMDTTQTAIGAGLGMRQKTKNKYAQERAESALSVNKATMNTQAKSNVIDWYKGIRTETIRQQNEERLLTPEDRIAQAKKIEREEAKRIREAILSKGAKMLRDGKQNVPTVPSPMRTIEQPIYNYVDQVARGKKRR